MTFSSLQYSKSEVNKAGEILVKYLFGNERIVSQDRSVSHALMVLNNWRSSHGYPINTFQATLRNKLKSMDTSALVAQRLKRLPSIVLKLKRFEKMKLARMQDIGGMRAVVSSLKRLRMLENNYNTTNFHHELSGYKDYINNPKEDGYRGVHLV